MQVDVQCGDDVRLRPVRQGLRELHDRSGCQASHFIYLFIYLKTFGEHTM